MPEATTRKVTLPGLSGRVDNLLPLQVRYYSRMHRQRTYMVEIGWKTAERGVAAKPVTLRLEVAGALIVPAEQILRPVDPDDTAKFFVTPLSLGRVDRYLLEIRQENVKIFEMLLKAKVVTQYFTIFLFVLAIFIPWLLSKYCTVPYQTDGLGPKQSLIKLIQSNTPDLGELNEVLPAWLRVKDWVESGTEAVGIGYAELCALCQRMPLSAYVCLALVVLTLISSWWHRPHRRRRRSEPIPLPA